MNNKFALSAFYLTLLSASMIKKAQLVVCRYVQSVSTRRNQEEGRKIILIYFLRTSLFTMIHREEVYRGHVIISFYKLLVCCGSK